MEENLVKGGKENTVFPLPDPERLILQFPKLQYSKPDPNFYGL